MAVATPWPAPRPAIANAHAATPSRGPQPPMLVGTVIASRTSIASGSSVPIDAVEPAARAATRNTPTCPATTTVEARKTAGRPPGHQRGAQVSRTVAPAAPATTAVPRQRPGRRARRPRRRPAIEPAITASAGRTGDGRRAASRSPSTIWTTWPAARSQTTLRSPAETSPASSPMPHAAVDVAQHAAGQRAVEELRAVVGRDRGAERDPQPSPRAISRHRQAETHGGQSRDGERPRSERPVDPAQTVHERPGPQPEDQDDQDHRAAGQAHPAPEPGALGPQPLATRFMSWVRRQAGAVHRRRSRRMPHRPAGQRRRSDAPTGCAQPASAARRLRRRRRSSARSSASSSQRASAAPAPRGRRRGPARPGGRPSAGPTERLRHPTHRRRDHRQAAGERLGHDQAVALLPGRQHEQVGAPRRPGRGRPRRAARRAGPGRRARRAPGSGAARSTNAGSRSRAPTQTQVQAAVGRARPGPRAARRAPWPGDRGHAQQRAAARVPVASSAAVAPGRGDHHRPGGRSCSLARVRAVAALVATTSRAAPQHLAAAVRRAGRACAPAAPAAAAPRAGPARPRGRGDSPSTTTTASSGTPRARARPRSATGRSGRRPGVRHLVIDDGQPSRASPQTISGRRCCPRSAARVVVPGRHEQCTTSGPGRSQRPLVRRPGHVRLVQRHHDPGQLAGAARGRRRGSGRPAGPRRSGPAPRSSC